MKRSFKITLIALAILLLISLLIISLPSFIDLTPYKDKIEGFIEGSIHRDVSIREIRLSILKGIGAELKDVRISKAQRVRDDLLDIKYLRITLRILPLLRKGIELKEISIYSPKVLLKNDRFIMVSKLHAPFSYSKGDRIGFEGINAELYKGKLLGDLFIEKEKGDIRYNLIHRIEKIELEDLMKDAISSKVTFSGPLKLEGDIKGVGGSLEKLEGKGSLDIGKGRINGLDLAKIIGFTGTVISKRPVSFLTDYDRISGHYTIKDGYLRTEDLEMSGEDILLRAKGSYGLIGSTLDFLVKGKIIDIPIEIEIGGTSSKPTYKLKSTGM